MFAVDVRRAVRLVLFLSFLVVVPSVLGSTIMGTVSDQRRNGMASVDVELLNDLHVMIRHAMTDGVGRFTFDNLVDGNYQVHVMPFRYDFDEQTRDVEIKTITFNSAGGGNTTEIVDFTLTPRKGTMAAAQADVVVAQDIPNDAKKSYDDSVKMVKQGKMDEAIVMLEQAIKVYPDYFLANNTLGSIYFNKHDYEHAAPPLIKASQVYDRSPATLYQLGISLTRLNYPGAAVIALNAASVLAPASPAIFTALGSAQRANHDYPAAEKSLLQAKKVTKSANAEIFKELAALYGEMKQYDKGADNLEQMLKSGNYTDIDQQKIKAQIKIWRDMSTKQTPTSTTKPSTE